MPKIIFEVIFNLKNTGFDKNNVFRKYLIREFPHWMRKVIFPIKNDLKITGFYFLDVYLK